MPAENVSSERSAGPRLPRMIAVGLHLAIGVAPYLLTGLVAPPAGVYGLAVVWLLFFGAVWRWQPRQPWLLLVVPVAAFAVWVAVVSAGDAWLGWTA